MTSDTSPLAFNCYFASVNEGMELADNHSTQEQSPNGESNFEVLSDYERSGSRSGEKFQIALWHCL